MSKPIALVVLSALIALVLVAGVYTTVLGAVPDAGSKSVRVQVDNFGLGGQASADELDSLGTQADPYDKTGSGCDHEAQMSPEDY